MSDTVGRRVRTVAGLLVLAELVVYVLVVAWIGVLVGSCSRHSPACQENA